MVVWAVTRTTVNNGDGEVVNFGELVDVGVTEQDADIIIENAKQNEDFDKVMSMVTGTYVYQKKLLLLKDFSKKKNNIILLKKQ